MPQSSLIPGRACDHCKLEVATCESCGEEIVFGTTEKGRQMPMDARTTTVYVKAGVAWIPQTGHRSHFASCTGRLPNLA